MITLKYISRFITKFTSWNDMIINIIPFLM